MKAEFRQIVELKKLLEDFERLAGQKINHEKSEFICSPNLENTLMTIITELLGMKAVNSHSKYLGLPASVSINKRETFREVEEKLGKKLQDWKNLILSWAGREILIKACLESIPMYTMSVFRLPRTMCEKLDSMIIRYWWGGGKETRNIHWSRKEIICKAKSLGGLGFRYMECLNDALLMKQLWRLLTTPDTLVSKVLRCRYFKREGLLIARSRPSDSYAWKSMCGVLNLFISGLEYLNDVWIWKHSFSGLYTVKSGYYLAYRWRMSKGSATGESSNWVSKEVIWNRLWRAKAPEYMKILLWRILYNAIPVRVNLAKRGMVIDKECALCGFPEESTDHLFLECWWAKSFWNSFDVNLCCSRPLKLNDWIWDTLTSDNKMALNKILVGLHLVWTNRNHVIHGKRCMDVNMISFKANCLLTQFEKRTLPGFTDGSAGGCAAGEGWEIFCDGSWSWRERNGGWAAVILFNGSIVECKTGFSRDGVSGLETEVNGIMLGLQLAADHRCSAARIFSDCANAIWLLQMGIGPEGNHVPALSQGHQFLKDRPGWSLLHIQRINNGVADSLATKARIDGWAWNASDAIPFIVADSLRKGVPGTSPS